MSDRDFSVVEATLGAKDAATLECRAAYVARGVIWFTFLENRISRVEEIIHATLLP